MALEENAVVRLTVGGLIGTEAVANVMHFRVKAVAGVAAPATGLAIIASAWGNAFDQAQSNAASWTNWEALQVRGTDVTYSPTTGKYSGGQTFEGIISPPIVGDSSGELLPPATAYVLSMRTGFSGKSKRGRNYLGGLPETANNAGAPVSAGVTEVQGLIDGFLATYGVGGGNPDWEMGVYSYRIATDRYVQPGTTKTIIYGGNPSPATAYTGITTCQVQNQWGSMRSRSFIS